MRAVTFQAPMHVEVSERPEPELSCAQDAIVEVLASGICGSDLHIYHGRVRIEPGFIVGHEFVGRVVQTGSSVRRVAIGDRVLGCFQTACGSCFYCLRGAQHKCDYARTFGHGKLLGALQGTQAERVLVPAADITLRCVPEGLSDEVALFAGDVAATACHSIFEAGVRAGDSVAVVGLGPVGLLTVQAALAAGAAPVYAIDTVAQRLDAAEAFGARAVHLGEQAPREEVRAGTHGRGVDAAIDAVGHPEALELAVRLARKAGTVVATGVYAEPCQVHMGLVWIKSLTLRAGQANVVGHVDRAVDMLCTGALDPSALVTHRMALDEAPAAYEIYDRREALKIALRP
jgi:2-desacetyl-2-hydroxyethyl bacteriochlorophyllide A dehydrogenase